MCCGIRIGPGEMSDLLPCNGPNTEAPNGQGLKSYTGSAISTAILSTASDPGALQPPGRPTPIDRTNSRTVCTRRCVPSPRGDWYVVTMCRSQRQVRDRRGG